jgi:predicted nucleic acid-binding protein
VAFELYQGCYNKRDFQALEQQFANFALLWPSNEKCSEILASYASAHLAFAVGILDALTAATGITHDLTLNTFNQKHFAAFPQLKTARPYNR